MSEGALAAQRRPGNTVGGEAQQLADLCSLDHSSRANSSASALSQGSGSVPCEHGPALPCSAAETADGGSPPAPAPAEALAADAAQAGPVHGEEQVAAAHAAPPPRRADAKSSALKALAGVSAVVSKSRKVDAEALQTIKMQRAKARAEGHAPGHSAAAASRAAPPAGVEPAAASPSAATGSQALGRAASTSSLPAPHSQLQSHGSASLGHAAPLPAPGQARMAQRRSPPPTPPQDLEALVSRMTINELVSLKQAVEGQLAKQAMALAQLQAGGGGGGDLLSAQAQYASLVLHSAQQAQLAQQLASQQQAAALQQALPQPLGQFGGLALPGGELSTPFACAPFPADAAFGPGDGGRHPALGLAQAAAAHSGSSPRCASAEQLLLSDALHSFLSQDPERQGPPSRQGSAASGSLGWGDRRTSGVLPSSALPAASRSRSLPAAEARFPERSPSMGFLAAGTALDAAAASVAEGMPGFFGGLPAEASQLERSGGAATPFGALPSRSGSLAAPLQQLPAGGQYHVGQQPYADPAHLHSFRPLR